MPQYSTVQLAQLCDRSERTIQLWLQSGKLPAQHVAGTKNRYEIVEADLALLLPQETVQPLIAEIADLTRRMDAIERQQLGMIAQIEQMAASVDAPAPTRVLRPSPVPYASASVDALPAGLVATSDFTQQHRVPANTAKRRVQDGHLPEVAGRWKQGNHFIQHALDAAGRRRFYEMFHDHLNFQHCPECPHDGG